MKIIIIYQYFGTPNGSWSTRFFEFTRRWIECGHEVTIVTAPYDKSDVKAKGFISYQEISGIKLIVINSADSNRLIKSKRILRSILFSGISSFFAITKKADVIIASSGPITVGFTGLIGKYLGSKKLIFEIRDLWPLGAIELGLVSANVGKIGLLIEKFIYRHSDLIVTCSIGMQRNLENRFKGLNIVTIPNVANENLINIGGEISNSDFPSWLNVSENKVLLYAGSLGLMDAVDEVIDGFIFSEVSKTVKLVIIGDGAERKILEKKVNDNFLENQIYFLGLLPKTEVVKWYKIARYSLVLFKDFPVLGTSSPNKLFDSIAYNVPIIQNTTGWIAELIESNKIGFNVKPKNPQDMYNIILKCENDFEHNNQKLNLLKICEEYKIQKMSDKYLLAIRGLNES